MVASTSAASIATASGDISTVRKAARDGVTSTSNLVALWYPMELKARLTSTWLDPSKLETPFEIGGHPGGPSLE